MSLIRFDSVRHKVLGIVMLTTLVALIVALSAIVWDSLRNYQNTVIADMATQSELLGYMTAPALTFDDQQLAQQNLNLLRLRAKIRAAAIYDGKGHVFAMYSVPGELERFPATPGAEGARVEGRNVIVFKSISDNGEVLGTVYLRADYEFTDRLLTLLGIAAVVSIVALGVAFLLSIRLQRVVSDPIQAISSIAHEVVEQQDYSRRAQKMSNDEVGALVDSFNNMLAVIEHHTQDLEKSNQDIAREVAERRTAQHEIMRLNTDLEARVLDRTAQLEAINVELAHAKMAAEQASQAKSTFLSNMSHELRTPLNAILGFTQLLKVSPTDLSPEKLDTYTSYILKAGEHLLVLINEILDLAKIESGFLSLSMEPVSLSELFQGCELLVRPMAEKRHITLGFTLPDDSFVMADRTRLKQVLLNLLSNAIKYNRDGGSVSVHVTENEAAHVRIVVRDTGIGLSQMQVDQLFQPFNRLGQEAGAEEGTGIGLVVTKRLVELMGGRIGVSSTPGNGSEFWIELQCHIGGHAEIEPGKREVKQVLQTATVQKKRTVLYVEDNPVNLKLIEAVIGFRADIGLITAADGRLGIELACAHLPDVILLDINLPGMNGDAVLKMLQRDVNTCNIPVIAVTANAMPKDVERGLTLGFFRYLTKPINVNELLQMLDEALALVERRRQT